MTRKRAVWIAGVTLLGGGLVAFIAGLALIANGPRGPAVGVAVPESRRVVVEEGQRKVEVSYRIENRGGSDLIIRGIETGCGCSVASIERTVIPPGESGGVTVEATVPATDERTLDIVAKTDVQSGGVVPFRLTVVGNRPIPHVAWHTPVAQFGVIEGSLPSGTIVLNTNERRGSEPWISEAVTTVPGLSIEGGLDDEEPTGADVVYRTYIYDLSLDERPEPGRLTGELILKDGRSNADVVLSVPVLGSVRPPVYAMPSALYASGRPDEPPEPMRLSLIRVGGEEFEVESVEPVTGLIVEEDDAREAGRGFLVRVADLSEDRRGTLIFRTDVPGCERVEVPYLVKAQVEQAPASK